ncbi:TlpA family protein disulfide reductase [Nonomuraea sp. SMC257]|uniref:TlpA family protein disulfide reductase n=1 Tax=Nonomuraea montanisoli TaxID=2741721 RepID=A0A7Y6M2P2_9ACTN|nr:TlpA family protein disulfide reductase [Nonomuraea montanisoli]NUW32372.1 TlpA family protein disulfide reductase [Nonomuraea montanisoli]
MPYLVAIMVLLGLLCLVNLLLTLGLVRRIKEHTKLIDALYEVVGSGGLSGVRAGAAIGEAVGDFDATTVDGDRVTRDGLAEGTVVAFLSPDCAGCREQLPELASWAAGQDRSRVVAVVDGREGDVAHLVTTLSPVARVIVEEATPPQVAEAFKLQAFPTFYQVAEGGKLLATAPKISRLPVGSPA